MNQATNDILTVLFFVIGFVFVVFLLACNIIRPRQILNRWAAVNNYEILSADYRWIRFGPFFWTTSKGQAIYYVTVRTPDGQQKQGWVRCGGWIMGVLTNQSEVRWDE